MKGSNGSDTGKLALFEVVFLPKSEAIILDTGLKLGEGKIMGLGREPTGLIEVTQ